MAGSPTKSPSSGLHKPTWRPSAKPAEHRALKSAAQKAAKEAAGTHYYEIKAKTTKDVPDSGLNSAASDAVVEGEEAEVVEVSLDTDFEKKEDKRESRKADKKAREEAEATGATVHTWNGETRRNLAGSPTKSPSSGLHKPTWRPSSKPAEHRKLTIKTASSVSQVAKNAIYGLSGPTKSPSTGLHKPTWKPTPGTPTGKPFEHRRLSNAHPGDLTTSTAGKGAFAEVGPSKSPSTGIHKPTWKPTQGKPSGKPVEPWKEGVESSHTEKKNSAHTDGEIEMDHRRLAGFPVSSRSSTGKETLSSHRQLHVRDMGAVPVFTSAVASSSSSSTAFQVLSTNASNTPSWRYPALYHFLSLINDITNIHYIIPVCTISI